jgi:hypothetical protein
VAEFVPSGQSAQPDAPNMSWYLPAAQRVQLEAPYEEYLPEGHFTHSYMDMAPDVDE